MDYGDEESSSWGNVNWMSIFDHPAAIICKIVCALVFLGCGLAVGFLFLLMGGIVPSVVGKDPIGGDDVGHSGWWALFAFVFFLFTPIPIALTVACRGVGTDVVGLEEASGIEILTSWVHHCGAFSTSILGTMGVGLFLVFIHCQIIGWFTFIMNVIGGFVIVVTFLCAFCVMEMIFRGAKRLGTGGGDDSLDDFM